MDLKSENDFLEFYENEYKYTIERYYENNKIKRNKIILLGIFILGILISLSLYIVNVSNIKDYIVQYMLPGKKILIGYIVALTFFIFLGIRSALKKVMNTLSEDIIRDIYTYIGDENPKNPVKYKPASQLKSDYFNKMELFNLDLLKYTGKNYSEVYYNKKNMCFCDVKLYRVEKTGFRRYYKKNGKKYYREITKRKYFFDGLCIDIPLNKKNTSQIYLIPNNLNDTVLQSRIMEYIKFKGVPVMLENLEFSRKYKVFCDDEIQARYILSLSLMEKINKLDEVFKEKKYIVFKEGKRFAICIEGLKLETIRKMTLSIFRNSKREQKILLNMYTNLNNLFKVYHILDLGNDLYEKI